MRMVLFVRCAIFLPDYRGILLLLSMAFLAATASDTTINVYRYGNDTYEHVGVLECSGYDDEDNLEVQCFTTDGLSVIASVNDCILLWDITSITTNEIFTICEFTKIDLDCNYIDAVVVGTADPSKLAIQVSGPEEIIMLDIFTREEVWRVALKVLTGACVSFARDDELVISGAIIHEHAAVLVVDSATGNIIAEMLMPQGLTDPKYIRDLAIHPPFIATGGLGLHVLRLTSECTSIEDPAPLVLSGHNRDIVCVRFNSCGDRLISGSDDQMVRLWDTTTWDCVFIVPTQIFLFKVVWCGDNRKIACCNRHEQFAQVYDSESGEYALNITPSVGNICVSSEFVIFM
jgi:WD40 repeat protein